jgi:hypothetical protein
MTRSSAALQTPNPAYTCSCGQADRRFDYECTNCGELFTGGETNEAPQTCICPNYIVDPAQMCQKHQAEYIAYLDEQAELDAIQQQYENQVVDK